MLAPLAVIVVLTPAQMVAANVVVVTEPEFELVYKLFISHAVKTRFQTPMSSNLSFQKVLPFDWLLQPPI